MTIRMQTRGIWTMLVHTLPGARGGDNTLCHQLDCELMKYFDHFQINVSYFPLAFYDMLT